MPDKALLMGINEYKSVPGLHGCLADVESMRGLLVDVFGFPPKQVKMLTDEEVTKDRVEEWIGWLFQGTGSGDRLVLHFSGHGSYTADRDADESDKVDELICLHDMDWKRPGSYLVDDELYELLGRVPPGAQMLVMLDNCHSGTGTRTITPAELEVLGSGARGLKSAKTFPLVVEHSTAQRRLARSVLSTGTSRSAAGLGDEAAQPTDNVLARFVPPPPEVKRRARSLRKSAPKRAKSVRALNHVLLAACRDNQTAADAHFAGEFHGAFTYHLTRILREVGPGCGLPSLIQRLKHDLAAAGFDQEPQLEAPEGFAEGPLFRPNGRGDHSVTVVGMMAPVPLTSTSPAPRPSWAGPTDDRALLAELLAAHNRFLDLAARLLPTPELGRTLVREGDLTGRHYVVYVHGIGAHPRDYYRPWWDAMKPYTRDLSDSDVAGVYWSDLVNRVATGRALEAPARAAEADELVVRIREILEDRALIEGAHEGTGSRNGVTASAGVATLEAPASVRGLIGLGGIDDFVRYLIDQRVRQAVIARFDETVRPLLVRGAAVEVISHSWGTVVAYEALRGYDADPAIPTGAVRNLFTAGSALSIAPVKARLLPSVRDGRRPRAVGRWINLDARYDAVGGPLKGGPFAVDQEYLDLPPVGMGAWPDLRKAHASYFQPGNVAVNKDIFARFIDANA